MVGMNVVRSAFASSADFRTDDTSDNNLSELVRIARKLSWLEPKVQRRNFPSVEEIQEKPRLPLHKEEGFKTFFFIAYLTVCNLCVIAQTKLIHNLVKLKHKCIF
jgi:hypothetical protein